MSVEGPSKADIECENNADGTCQVKYTPTEPGNYIVNVLFADQHIRGDFASLAMRAIAIDRVAWSVCLSVRLSVSLYVCLYLSVCIIVIIVNILEWPKQ